MSMYTQHPLPPVNRLPREVLTTIFLLASHPAAPYRPPNLAHIPTPHPPTTISHVCRNWRHIALTTPRLWTDIRILPHQGDAFTPPNHQALIEPILRCVPHAFTLSIRMTDAATQPGWVNAALPPHLSRCTSLRLTGQIDQHPALKLSLFPGPIPLRSLELVHITLPSMRQLIDMLELCPSLQSLTMRDLAMQSDLPGSVRQRRKLKALRRLAMQVDENFDIIQGFFPRVITPALSTLELAYGPEGPHVVGPFIIYDDCMVSVTSLIMRGEVLATDFVLSMMQKAIPLRSLTLYGCGVTDEFLQILAKRQTNPEYMSIGGGGYTAPKLERVRLSGCDYVTGGALVALVKERRRASEPPFAPGAVKVEEECAGLGEARWGTPAAGGGGGMSTSASSSSSSSNSMEQSSASTNATSISLSSSSASGLAALSRPARLKWVEARDCEGIGREEEEWLREWARERVREWDWCGPGSVPRSGSGAGAGSRRRSDGGEGFGGEVAGESEESGGDSDEETEERRISRRFGAAVGGSGASGSGSGGGGGSGEGGGGLR